MAALVLLAVFQLAGTGSAGAADPVSEQKVLRAAGSDPKVEEQRLARGELGVDASVVDGVWEVSYFDGDEKVALVLVDPESGKATESWTGYQVAWKMARGYEGAFGHKLNAPYVFLPLCALFLLGLFDWRRPRRVANLDLLVLLGFGLSHYFFNRAEIGISVPLVYPVLLYLLGRALWIGFRGPGEGLRPVWPAAWLLVAALFLLGVRVGLNVADSGAIDVGYASVVGADRIGHGEPIYGNFPADVSQGDTYGPANYLAYVPAELVWPWSGSWDDLPAAHGAAVIFDLGTFLLLTLLGLRLRPGAAGRRLAATLGFGWAAYPYTAYVLESNSNDALVSLLLVATLLALARPLARGALASLVALTKIAPVLLAPMLMTYTVGETPDEGVRERKPRPQDPLIRRPATLFAAGFVLVSAVLTLWPALDPGLATVYERTIGYQQDRDSPFGIWGQLDLGPLRSILIAAVAALSLLLAFRPRRKTPVQAAALGAALLIALQLTMQHWFYLYVVWFFPLLLVALAASRGEPAASPARRSPPAPVR